MFFKENIKKLKRYQTSLNRDLIKGINLDRNERVDVFNNKLQHKIKKKLSSNIFNSTPDISSLYTELAKYHKVKSKNIYITQGITEGIFQILFSLTKKNDEVVIMNETYPMYKILCNLNNIKFKTWDFNNNLKLNIQNLKSKITNKTRILFLVNPNLPIEFEFSKKLKEEIYKLCLKKNIILVYDEAYHYFGSKSELNNSTKKKNLLVMRTFSKAWGLPGIRLGYMTGTTNLIEYISKCRSLVETNGFSYEIAKMALKNKHILEDHVRTIKQGYNFLLNKFNLHKENYYGGKVTNAILLDLKTKRNCQSLKKFLKKKKIYIRHGFQKPIDTFIRISLCSPKKLNVFFNNYLKWKKLNYRLNEK